MVPVVSVYDKSDVYVDKCDVYVDKYDVERNVGFSNSPPPSARSTAKPELAHHA